MTDAGGTVSYDWGDLNDPRVFPALAMSLMMAATGATGRKTAGGVLKSLQLNAKLNARLQMQFG